jgi:hypothetical protein
MLLAFIRLFTHTSPTGTSKTFIFKLNTECTQHDSFRQDSYDMTIFQDEDGSAYLICSVMNQFVGISLLSDDYLKTVELVSYIGGKPWCIFDIYDTYNNILIKNPVKDKHFSSIKEPITCGRHI